MEHSRDIQKMRRYGLLVYIVSGIIFCCGVGSLTLFFNPAILTIPANQHHYYHSQPLWLIVGILFMFFAVWTAIRTERYLRHCFGILKNVRSVSMNFSIEIESWSDSTDYIGKLYLNGLNDSPCWQVKILSSVAPSRAIKDCAENGLVFPVQVYFDPWCQKPAIVETQFGLLWVVVGTEQLLT